MHEKTKHTILWIGAIGGLVALTTLTLSIVATQVKPVAAFLAKVRGK